jgi:hypothetical protein
MVSVHLDRHGRGYLRHEGIVREVLNLSLTKAKVIPQGSTFGYPRVVFFVGGSKSLRLTELTPL